MAPAPNPRPQASAPSGGLHCLIAFLAGAATLAIQLSITRLMGALLGREFSATLATQTALFAGMTAGSAFLHSRERSRQPRPNFWLATLSVCSALTCISWPWILSHLPALLPTSSQPSPLPDFILATLILSPVSLAAGAWFPALDSSPPTNPQPTRLRHTYAANVCGSALMAWITPHVLLPSIGARGTLGLAALTLAASALALKKSQPNPATQTRPTTPTPLHLLIPAFTLGFVSLTFQFLVTSLLAPLLEGTLFTWGTLLSIHLTAATLGAFTLSHSHTPPTRQFLPPHTRLPAALLNALLLLWIAPALHSILQKTGAADTLLLLLIVTPFSWMCGQLWTDLALKARNTSGSITSFTTANLLGCTVAGPILATFLHPIGGARLALTVLAILAATTSLCSLPRPLPKGPWTGVALTLTLVGLILPSILPPGILQLPWPPGEHPIWAREGLDASIAVTENASGQKTLRVNHRLQMGGTAVSIPQQRQADIPLLLHPAPHHVLFLGLGTGITADATRHFPDLLADAVELLPGVAEASTLFVGNSPTGTTAGQLRLHRQDARRFVANCREPYDVIIGDLFHPGLDGAASLYSLEHFQRVKAALAPNGLFCQWLPIHQLPRPALRSIIHTFLTAFPNTEAWLLHPNPDLPVIGLVGIASDTPKPQTIPTVENRVANQPGLRDHLRSTGLPNSMALLGSYLAGPDSLKAFTTDARLNTESKPAVSWLTLAPPGPGDPSSPGSRLVSLLAAWKSSAPRETMSLFTIGSELTPRLKAYIMARDLYLEALVLEARDGWHASFPVHLKACQASLFFVPAYAHTLKLIQAVAAIDPAEARKLFQELERVRPDQPIGRQILAPLLDAPSP